MTSLFATIAAMLAAAPVIVSAADGAVLGRRLSVSDTAAAGRKLVATAREGRSLAQVTGDPLLPLGMGGATLEVLANGAGSSWQTFGLAPGTSASGKPFWRRRGTTGFEYRDPAGEQGPVRKIVVDKAAGGTMRMKAVLAGPALAVLPPNPGTDGAIALTLSQGDRTCVRYGTEGRVRNTGAQHFSVRRPTIKGCAAPPAPSGEVLALSYNVAGLPEGLSGSHPATNTPIISPLLNAYDLVLVQESWQTPDPNPLAPTRVYHELLAADADHPYKTASAPLPLGTDPRRPEALVSDGLNAFSRFAFTHLGREMWNGCWSSAADCLSQKGFMVLRAVVAPGVVIDVYDLHMEAGRDPEDDALRDQAVTQLAAYLTAFSAGRPVIVGGDFNLRTTNEPDASQYQRLLAETGLTDVCAALGCPEPGRIDKFAFRSGGGVVLEPLTWRFETDVFVDGAGDPLSDHDALAVRFRWTAAE